ASARFVHTMRTTPRRCESGPTRWSCGGALRRPLERAPQQRADEKSNPLDFANLRTASKNIEVLLLNLFENLEAAAAEQFEIDREAPIDLVGEREASQEQVARDSNGFAHRGFELWSGSSRCDVFDAGAVFVEQIERKVDAVLFPVHRYI